uniref:Secreted protein n=1 Tax=Anopheles coluzzii TaxID=1518534 RepID=A0A8W7PK12_ANOCL
MIIICRTIISIIMLRHISAPPVGRGTTVRMVEASRMCVTTILAQEIQPRSLVASFVVLCCVRVISDKVQRTIECSDGHTNAALW